MVFDVRTVPVGTPGCAVKLKASGVVSLEVVNVPPTDLSLVMLTVQVMRSAVLLVVSHPSQALKIDPAFAAAVSVTLLPDTKDALHNDPQSMPEGELDITPFPIFPTVSVNPPGTKLAMLPFVTT